MTDPTPDKIAGYVIDAIRHRDDITHVSRYDYENRRIDVIVEPDDLKDEGVIIPSEVLHQLSDAGFEPVSAHFSKQSKRPPETRVMSFDRPED
ncbi:hypothetical protein [Natrinema sp. DC36]|uniref:hypothetical protein n=1 Tax=Natrinema sp. DC36 TaxID=2878680 RepID=UPI001CEFFC19|nr:hypothetical protein [Natrinema sp. DC36]